MVDLTKEFIEREGLNAQTIALEAIQSDQGDPNRQRRTLNFNLFDIEIDYAAGSVSVEEVISPCRDEVVPLAEFLEVLRSVGNGCRRSSGGA